jgi:hypothetical protein
MISYDLLHSVSEKLAAFRGDGRGDVLFDTRDPGNYGDHYWDQTVELMKANDPTGLALAMLVNEKIEATIDGSKVKLSRVVREKGFTERLHAILDIKEEIDTVLAGPMAVFKRRVDALIADVSPDFGESTTREVALSMRDAIYCMSQGMTLRWVQCDPGVPNLPVALQTDIAIMPTLADFVQALKYQLPIGVHLARIGRDQTAIGIKKPGRIVYMSSMRINVHSGEMREERTHDHHVSETLDLDNFSQRYPKWFKRVDAVGFAPAGQVDAKITTVKQIPRDSIIWLAMMMELANQEMGRIDPATIKLSESARMAITHGASDRNTLPVPYTPSWVYQPPALAEVLDSLGLSEWEMKFLAPAINDIEPLDFIPVGDSVVGYHLTEKRLTPDPDRQREEWVKFISISEGIAGTQDEVQATVRKIYQKNLADYLISWGNRTFAEHWRQDRDWFLQKLTDNALKAMDASCSKVRLYGFERWNVANVFKQSPKHKGFRPVCFIAGKGDCDVKTHVYPQNDNDIVEVLGLASKAELPDYLHGWSRDLGWTTCDSLTEKNPGLTNLRWYFACDKDGISDDPEASYEGFIYFNSASHPTGTPKPRW